MAPNPIAPRGEGRNGKRPTLYDVARAADVSHQTVSQVVNGGPHVRPATRERVERAVAELDYRPNLNARALASPRADRLGALFFDRYDQVGPTLNMQAAVDHARAAGYVVDVIGVEHDHPGRLPVATELLLQSGVAGIVAFAPTARAIDLVRESKLPLPVIVEAEMKAEGEGRPDRSAYAGAALLADHLANLGHTQVLHITGPLSWLSSEDRIAQIRGVGKGRFASLREVEGDWTASSGYHAIRSAGSTGYTAVMASNDQMALGALKALRELGVRVPNEISVVGHDDIPESEYFEPSLTTVREDHAGRGRLAMERLLAIVEQRDVEGPNWHNPPELLIRASSAVAIDAI